MTAIIVWSIVGFFGILAARIPRPEPHGKSPPSSNKETP